MRALQTKDLGLFSKIIAKLEIKEEAKKLFVTIEPTGKTDEEIEQEKKGLENELAFDVGMLLIENYWKAEKDIHKLLANMTGKNVKEVEKLPLHELIELLQGLASDESLASFFNLVAG